MAVTLPFPGRFRHQDKLFEFLKNIYNIDSWNFQLFLDENSDALSLAGNMTYGEVKYLKISIEPELELKLTSGLTVDDDFLKVLPMKNYSNVRFQIFILSGMTL